MAKAAVDPEELMRFASALRQFNTTTRNELSLINRQFNRLGETWQDEEQAQFAESFALMVRVLGRFLDDSERQVPLLARKAECIRDYLRSR